MKSSIWFGEIACFFLTHLQNDHNTIINFFFDLLIVHLNKVGPTHLYTPVWFPIRSYIIFPPLKNPKSTVDHRTITSIDCRKALDYRLFPSLLDFCLNEEGMVDFRSLDHHHQPRQFAYGNHSLWSLNCEVNINHLEPLHRNVGNFKMLLCVEP